MSESLPVPRMQGSMRCTNAACWAAHKGLHLPLNLLSHVSLISTCSSSKFRLGRDHLLVISLYNSSAWPKSRLSAEMLLQLHPKPCCKEPPNQSREKKEGMDSTKQRMSLQQATVPRNRATGSGDRISTAGRFKAMTVSQLILFNWK